MISFQKTSRYPRLSFILKMASNLTAAKDPFENLENKLSELTSVDECEETESLTEELDFVLLMLVHLHNSFSAVSGIYC